MRTVEFVKWLDGENRMRVRFEVERGRGQGFVVQWESLIADRWTPGVRYDTAHSYAHRDLMKAGGEAEKTPLDTQDFNEALTLAEGDITETWKDHRMRFEKWLQE